MMTERPPRQPRVKPVLTGETYGILTVTGQADKRDSRGNRYVHVRCECGVEKIVMAGNLRRGLTSSCGDRKHAKARPGGVAPMSPGERHGRLTTVERVGTTVAGAAIWLCSCECGGTKTAVTGTLRSGRIVSCGCIRIGGFVEVDYSGAHRRVTSKRGKASEHSCVDCGRTADDWSLAKRRVDPSRLYWQWVPFRDGRMREVPYSRDPEDYEPRCRSCHLSYDHGSHTAQAVTDTDRAALTDLYSEVK